MLKRIVRLFADDPAVGSSCRAPLTVEPLEDRAVPSALTLGAMGDSFTARYTTDPVIPGVLEVQGEFNWVDQLETLRPTGISISDGAIPGQTSTQLLADQLPAMTALAASGTIEYAVIETGAADALFQFPHDIFRNKPERFIDTVTANVRTAVDAVTNAGNVHIVLTDIPDITVTPYFLSNVTSNHTHVRKMSDAIRAANAKILKLASSRGIPVVDFDGLFHLTQHPMQLGGATLPGQFTPDGLHPRTALQGLLADTILEALTVGYGENVNVLRLSDQEILDAAGIAHAPSHTFFDVHPFVILGGGSHVMSSAAPTLIGGDVIRLAQFPGLLTRFEPAVGESTSVEPGKSSIRANESAGDDRTPHTAYASPSLNGVYIGDPDMALTGLPELATGRTWW